MAKTPRRQGRDPTRPDRDDTHGRSVTDPGALNEPPVFEIDEAGLALRIENYRVDGVLGRGGMGVVYEVIDRRTRERFALKTIEIQFLELDETAADQRFQHEITALKRLEHPGIVRLHDSGIARHPMGYDLAYYVMELVHGETLAPDIREGVVHETAGALDIIKQMAGALAYLDEHGILHRDIKPANILVEDSGRAVLMDFGLARSAEFTQLTMSGQLVGTFSYMSPERLAAEELDITSDVYSLGVILFQMLCGFHPYGGETPSQLMDNFSEGIRWPSEFHVRPGGPEVKRLLEGMLDPEQGQRPLPDEVAREAERVEGIARKRRGRQPAKNTVVAPRPTGAPARRGAVEVEPLSDATQPPVAAGLPDPADRSASLDPMVAIQAAMGPTWMTTIVLTVGASCIAFFGGYFVRGAVQPVAIVPEPIAAQLIEAQPVRPTKTTEPKVVSAGPAKIIPAKVASAKVAPAKVASTEPPPVQELKPRTFENATEAYGFARNELDAGRRWPGIEALRVAVKLNPVHADAHLLLADSLRAAKEGAEAVRHYKMYLALRPEAGNASKVRAMVSELGSK